MNISHKKSGGFALFATLMTTGIICVFIGSYLSMVRSESQLTTHSHTWNMAIPVAEAGIEEALTQLKFNHTNQIANNNWELKNDYWYMRSRKLSSEAYYVVGISKSHPPLIVAEGFVRSPLGTNFISRTVVVQTALNMLFPNGMLADQNVRLNGMNIVIDSFDSRDERFSTAGRYVTAKRKDNGTLVTNSDLTNEFYLGNAKVYGKIASGPHGGFENRPNLVVGNTAWHTGNNKGVQPGAFTKDVNVTLIEVESPITSAISPQVNPQTGYKYVLGTGDYQISSPNTFDGGNILITGKARVLVTENFDFRHLITLRSNASLELYVSAPSGKIGGQGVQNNTGIAANFVYYGLPSNESLTFSGNGEFVGCIYAPNAVFTLGGGGNSSGDFAGASVTKTVDMNGQYEFHFDEQLKDSGPSSGYIAISWDEANTTWNTILGSRLTANQVY